MTSKKHLLIFLFIVMPGLAFSQNDNQIFNAEIDAQVNPWTHLNFANDPANFQFAIVSDRTGGHREGIFGEAVSKLNLLMPEFVMSVGDLIEGYLEDTAVLNAQWREFHGLIQPLKMPFFFLPGNHDISNQVMRELWQKQFGRSYYHFTYQDVLFIAMDTNDGEGVSFSEQQLNYVEKAIQENPDVRWTFIFMHHPVWKYEEEKGFSKIEAALKDRKYSVLAGHQHRYVHEERHEHNYYVLGTTGGGSSLHGPEFGRFDHVTWVTMTDEAPVMVNLKLDGILPHDISNTKSLKYAQQLLENTEFKSMVLFPEDKVAGSGQVRIYFTNSMDQPLAISGRFFHHHQLEFEKSQFDLAIEPSSDQVLKIDYKPENSNTSDLDPIDVQWTMAYQVPGRPVIDLDGSYQIMLNEARPKIINISQNIFHDQLEVSFTEYEKDLPVHYTLDGTTPGRNSPIYEQPLMITETTTIRARAITAEGLMSRVDMAEVEKVQLKKPVKKGKARVGRLTMKYYEGNWQNLPDFSDLTPEKTGYAEVFDPETLAGRADHYALVLEGLIEVPKTGMYNFFKYADDAARLYIGDRLVIEGVTGKDPSWESGLIPLEAGLHKIRVEYLEKTDDQELRLSYRDPDNKGKFVDFGQLYAR